MIAGVDQPLWFLLPLALLTILWMVPGSGVLPGSWRQIMPAALADYLAMGVEEVRSGHGHRLQLVLLWTLLGGSLATVLYGYSSVPVLGNLSGRVLVIDMANGTSAGGAVRNARRFVSEQHTTRSGLDIPTGVIAVSSESFNVVPLTTDLAYIERYLQVLDHSVMPVAGRNPLLGIRHAERVLTNADVIAGQTVLFTSDTVSQPAGTDYFQPGFQLWIVAGSVKVLDSWRAYSGVVGQRVVLSGDVSKATRSLEVRRQRALQDVLSIRERRELTPWLILLILPLWLVLYFRSDSSL